jgi:DNA polymerase III subunit beta
MKFTLKKSKILDILGKIQGIAGRKTSNAIVSCVLIKAFEDGIKLYVTDYETGFIGFYPVEVESTGSIAVNARKLFEIVRDFPTEDILVNEVENYWIEIGNYNVQFHLVGMNPESFPDVPEIEDISFIEVESRNFKKMVDKTSMLIGSVEDKRPHVLGICFETAQIENECRIKITSTDGNRLTQVEVPCMNETGMNFDRNTLIQKKGFNELSKIVFPQENVFIGIKENKFFLKQQQETVSMQLVNGVFPNISELIALKNAKEIILNKQLFSMMLKRMSIFSTEDYKGVIFNFKEDRMIITSTNPVLGESKEEMFIDYPDVPIEVAFNPKYFIDALSVIDEEQVILSIVDAQNPCLVHGEKDQNCLCIIMPMKI